MGMEGERSRAALSLHALPLRIRIGSMYSTWPLLQRCEGEARTSPKRMITTLRIGYYVQGVIFQKEHTVRARF